MTTHDLRKIPLFFSEHFFAIFLANARQLISTHDNFGLRTDCHGSSEFNISFLARGGGLLVLLCAECGEPYISVPLLSREETESSGGPETFFGEAPASQKSNQ